MNVESVKKRVASRLSIPPLPAILSRIDEKLRDPDVGVREIGELVAQDPPLAARVLRVANSSYYGLKQPVVTVEHAASVLGINALRNMLMQVSLFQAWGHVTGGGKIDLAALWKHSILTGQIASSLRKIAHAGLDASPEEMYVAGLLHDIGKFVLLDTFPAELMKAIDASRETGEPQHVAEQRVIGMSHTQIGALIAKRWALPDSVSRAINYHHDVGTLARKDPIVGMIVVANELSNAVLAGKPEKVLGVVHADTFKLLGIDPDTVVGLGEQAVETAREIRL
jgi:putative nucleotidyltransferase with HDIG domain